MTSPPRSYQPDQLAEVWPVIRHASRGNLDTGMAAAIWTADKGSEISGSAEANTHVLSMALRPYRCEAWADGKRLAFDHCRTASLQIMAAGLTPRAFFSDPLKILHVYLPHDRLAEIAAVAPGALELRDPLAQFDPDLAHACGQLVQELQGDCVMSQLHFDALNLSIAVQLVRRWSNRGLASAPAKAGLPPALLRRVKDYLMAHLAEDVSLSALAAIANLSTSHFARAFRQSTGVPPHRWLTNQRIARGRELLEIGDLTLAEIALACGFADQSHFTVAFRSATGVTPGAYRREVRG